MEKLDHPITIALIAANVIVSLLAMNNRDMLSKSLMWPYGVKRYNQFYRFITSGFVHADYVHLFFNMFTLYFFGRLVETYFAYYGLGGNIAYIALYVTALVASDLPTYFKQKDNYESKQMYADVMYWFVGVCSLIFLLCMFFIDQLAHLLATGLLLGTR